MHQQSCLLPTRHWKEYLTAQNCSKFFQHMESVCQVIITDCELSVWWGQTHLQHDCHWVSMIYLTMIMVTDKYLQQSACWDWHDESWQELPQFLHGHAELQCVGHSAQTAHACVCACVLSPLINISRAALITQWAAVTDFRVEPVVHIPLVLWTVEKIVYQLKVTFFTRIPDLHVHSRQKKTLKRNRRSWFGLLDICYFTTHSVREQRPA